MGIEAETASVYRAEAVRLRTVAERALHAEIKAELLTLAARFEKLAQFAETKLGAVGPSPSD